MAPKSVLNVIQTHPNRQHPPRSIQNRNHEHSNTAPKSSSGIQHGTQKHAKWHPKASNMAPKSIQNHAFLILKVLCAAPGGCRYLWKDGPHSVSPASASSPRCLYQLLLAQSSPRGRWRPSSHATWLTSCSPTLREGLRSAFSAAKRSGACRCATCASLWAAFAVKAAERSRR